MTSDNLEQKLEFDNSKLENSFEFLDSQGRKIVYFGKVYPYFEGQDVRGETFLGKYEKTDKTKKKLKIISILPPKIEFKNIVSPNFENIWNAKTVHGCYFISDGETKTDDKAKYSYRGALKSELANKGIALSTEVFDKVFAPIDAELMHRYQVFTRGVK